MWWIHKKTKTTSLALPLRARSSHMLPANGCGASIFVIMPRLTKQHRTQNLHSDVLLLWVSYRLSKKTHIKTIVTTHFRFARRQINNNSRSRRRKKWIPGVLAGGKNCDFPLQQNANLHTGPTFAVVFDRRRRTCFPKTLTSAACVCALPKDSRSLTHIRKSCKATGTVAFPFSSVPNLHWAFFVFWTKL